MKYEMILYIAIKELNSLMGDLDLKPDYKCFMHTQQFLTFSTTTKITDPEDYIEPAANIEGDATATLLPIKNNFLATRPERG